MGTASAWAHTPRGSSHPGRLARRIDRRCGGCGFAARERPQVFICGPAGLVEMAGQLLVELGHEPEFVKTERFGPSS